MLNRFKAVSFLACFCAAAQGRRRKKHDKKGQPGGVITFDNEIKLACFCAAAQGRRRKKHDDFMELAKVERAQGRRRRRTAKAKPALCTALKGKVFWFTC
jgi:hypothetical protein